MATDETNQQSPFTRPGFLVAAAFVVILVVVGIVLGVNATTRDSDEPGIASPSSADSTSEPSATAPSEDATEAGACRVEGETLEGSLSTAPAVEWQYQGTMAFPTSDEFGPTQTTAEGVRTCFQRSPEGALLAAANGAAQATDGESIEAWLEYFLAEGPNREAVLGAGPGSGSDTSGVRVQIAGFRMLNFDGDTASVDVALRASIDGQTITMSSVYALVWENDDWKMAVQDPDSPVDFATIPDLSGYVPWGE